MRPQRALWMIDYFFPSVKFNNKTNLWTSVSPQAHLQCDVVGFRGYTLHCFVIAATSAAVKDHAGRDVGVFRVLRILLEDVHQHFPRLAHTLSDDLREWDD